MNQFSEEGRLSALGSPHHEHAARERRRVLVQLRCEELDHADSPGERGREGEAGREKTER